LIVSGDLSALLRYCDLTTV